MQQHNRWKTKKLQKFATITSLWGLGIILATFNLILKKKIDFSMISTFIGIFALFIGVFLEILERYLWKTVIMRFPLLDNYWTPVLIGRWEGILTRDGKPHKFIIEIKQSFTSISCNTYSVHSHSETIAAEILYNEQIKSYQLIYYWEGKTKNTTDNAEVTNKFCGLTILNIQLENRNAVAMEGEYFTNRQPSQTRGILKMEFRQKSLKNGF